MLHKSLGGKVSYSCDFRNLVQRYKRPHNRTGSCPSCQPCKPPVSFPCHSDTRGPGFLHILHTYHCGIYVDRCEFHSSRPFHRWPHRESRLFGCTALAWWFFRIRNSSEPSLDRVDMAPGGTAKYTNAHKAPPGYKALHMNEPHRFDYIEDSSASRRNNSNPWGSSWTRSDTPGISNHHPTASYSPTWSYKSDAGYGSNSDKTKPTALAAPDRNKRDTPTWRNPAPG